MPKRYLKRRTICIEPMPTPLRASMLFLWIPLEVPGTTSWPGKVSSLNLLTCPSSTMPLGLLMISRQERYFFVLFFFFLYSDIINLITKLLSFIPTHRETTERTRWVRIELGRNFLRKHFLTGFRIYGTIYQMSWGLPISVFLLLRNYALPSIKIRPLTPSALIPPGQKSAVS